MELAGFILVSLAAGVIGSLYTRKEIPGWYAGLRKPKLNPPSWVFAPVWTTLYILMGISAWLVWREGGLTASPAALFGAQLALNTLWSIVFFGRHRIDLARVVIALLWIAIAATGVTFGATSMLAAALLAPYLAWVTFASYLNFSLWQLNPTNGSPRVEDSTPR